MCGRSCVRTLWLPHTLAGGDHDNEGGGNDGGNDDGGGR